MRKIGLDSMGQTLVFCSFHYHKKSFSENKRIGYEKNKIYVKIEQNGHFRKVEKL